jgi:hypothetical protein
MVARGREDTGQGLAGVGTVSPGSGGNHGLITPDRFDAVLFDLDGVLTSTARIHSRCWKTMFDDFLGRRAVDGKPRYEGVRSFLASRNISSPRGLQKTRRLPSPSAVSATARTNW